MAMEKLKFTVSREGLGEYTVTKEFGQTIEDNIAAFGADVVNSHFVRSAVIQIQANVRSGMTPNKDGVKKINNLVQAQGVVDAYKIKVQDRPEPVEKAKLLLDKLSDADLAELGLKRATKKSA